MPFRTLVFCFIRDGYSYLREIDTTVTRGTRGDACTRMMRSYLSLVSSSVSALGGHMPTMAVRLLLLASASLRFWILFTLQRAQARAIHARLKASSPSPAVPAIANAHSDHIFFANAPDLRSTSVDWCAIVDWFAENGLVFGSVGVRIVLEGGVVSLCYLKVSLLIRQSILLC